VRRECCACANLTLCCVRSRWERAKYSRGCSCPCGTCASARSRRAVRRAREG
jgi:hypothetical protein